MAQKAVVAEPSRPEDRCRLASLTLQQGASDAALAILTTASSENNMEQQRNSLALRAIAHCLSKNTHGDKTREGVRLAQKAIMLSPMVKKNWASLAFVRSYGT